MHEGKVVWITRPEGQAETLSLSLADINIRARLLPMLEIVPLALDEKIKNKVQELDQFDLLFFISTNAATLGMECIQNYWPQFPAQLDIYAVGPTTAKVIESYDLKAEFPGDRMSSEALLALDSLQNVAGKKALIVRGEGGRELLATGLKDKGVVVDYLELYRRTCPEYSDGELKQLFQADLPKGVVISSAEALDNFAELLLRNEMTAESMAVFVSSGRIASKAKKLGFRQTIIMSGADDKSIIESLKENINFTAN